MVLACLMDLREPRPGLVRRVPRGVLVGLAMAVKLTPGVFVVHFLVTRRWKEAATAVGTAVAVTLGVWVLLPQASFAFWGGALQDPARLGPEHGHVQPVDPRLPAAGRPRGDAGHAALAGLRRRGRGVRVLAGPPALPRGRHDRRGRRGRADGLPAVTGGVDPPLPLGRRGDLRAARRRPAARPPPAVGRARGHRVLPVPAAVVGHLLAQPPRLARAAGRVLQNADVVGALAALVLLWWVTRPRDGRRRGWPSPAPTLRARRRSRARCRRRAAGRRRHRCGAGSTAASS